MEDPENRIPVHEGDVSGETGGEVVSELMEHRFVDVSWQEDSDAVIPVAPMDSWGVGSVYVTQIFKVNCECEEEGEGKRETNTMVEEDQIESAKENVEKVEDQVKAKPKQRKDKGPGQTAAAASHPAAAAAVPTATDEELPEKEKIPPYVPQPLQRQPYPWVGLSRAKKKRPRHRPLPPPPSATANKAALMEGRRVGQQAACTCQLQCPPVIYRQIPHTTQSNMRARYLKPSALGAVSKDIQKPASAVSHVSGASAPVPPPPPPQCEACFGAPTVNQEEIEVNAGVGSVYLERRKMSPESWAPRFVDCGFQIPGRRRAEGDVNGENAKKPTAPKKKAGKRGSKKVVPPRLSIEGGDRDDPYDPLHAARLIPNIHLKPGVSVRAGQEQLVGPPFPKLDAHVRPENAEFFGDFDIDACMELDRVVSDTAHAARTRRVKVSLPTLKPVPKGDILNQW